MTDIEINTTVTLLEPLSGLEFDDMQKRVYAVLLVYINSGEPMTEDSKAFIRSKVSEVLARCEISNDNIIELNRLAIVYAALMHDVFDEPTVPVVGDIWYSYIDIQSMVNSSKYAGMLTPGQFKAMKAQCESILNSADDLEQTDAIVSMLYYVSNVYDNIDSFIPTMTVEDNALETANESERTAILIISELLEQYSIVEINENVELRQAMQKYLSALSYSEDQRIHKFTTITKMQLSGYDTTNLVWPTKALKR